MALVIAMAMVLGMMSITAFAAKGDSHTITVPTDDTHTYAVYQIFKGILYHYSIFLC